MKLLLVEDSEEKTKKFKELEKSNQDINFVATTQSSTEGLKYLRRFKPEGVILDLELNNGEGSGFDFLNGIKKMKLDEFPKIVVTTNVCSQTVYDYLHQNNVDFIFYKKQQNYSEENVINTLLLLKDFEKKDELSKIKEFEKADEEAFNETLEEMIENELETIGVGKHLIGYKYLQEAIKYVVLHKGDATQLPVIKYLTAQHKSPGSTISRNISNAIAYAWKISAPEELAKIYTSRIDRDAGIPRPNEFIYFYAEKIEKELGIK